MRWTSEFWSFDVLYRCELNKKKKRKHYQISYLAFLSEILLYWTSSHGRRIVRCLFLFVYLQDFLPIIWIWRLGPNLTLLDSYIILPLPLSTLASLLVDLTRKKREKKSQDNKKCGEVGRKLGPPSQERGLILIIRRDFEKGIF